VHDETTDKIFDVPKAIFGHAVPEPAGELTGCFTELLLEYMVLEICGKQVGMFCRNPTVKASVDKCSTQTDQLSGKPGNVGIIQMSGKCQGFH